MKKNIFIIGVGRLLQILIGLVSIRLMTTILSSAEAGNVYLILSFASCFALVFLSPVGLYLNRRLHKWHNDGTLIIRFKQYNLYLISVVIISFPIMALAKFWIGMAAGMATVPLCLIVAAYLYANTWNSFLIPSLNMLNYRLAFVIFSVGTVLSGLIFSVIFVLNKDPSGIMWILGQTLGFALFFLIALVYFNMRFAAKSSSETLKEITPVGLRGVFNFAMPLTLTTFFMWLQNQSYRLIVERNIGAEFLGQLAVGLGVAASIGAAVESFVQQIYYPLYYSEINSHDMLKRRMAWEKMVSITLPLYLFVMLFVAFLSNHIVNILVDAKFRAAGVFAVFGVGVELSRIISNVLSTVAHSEMKTGALAKPYVYGGIASGVGVLLASRSVFYFYLIPAALVLGGGLTLWFMYRNMRRLMPFTISRHGFSTVLLMTMPFPAALLIRNPQGSILISLFVTGFFGLYMAVSQYYIYRKTFLIEVVHEHKQ